MTKEEVILLRRIWRFVYRHRRPLRSLIRAIRVRRVSADALVLEQSERFARAGLDWLAARSSVEAMLGPNIDPSSHRSEHYEMAAAVVASRPIRRILEIGTAEGEFTSFLADLAPLAEVVTIDLPSADRRFWHATRGGQRWRMVADGGASDSDLAARDQRLAAHANIRLCEMNSLALSTWPTSSFDLVWVDGDHSYPIVVSDIVNAIRLVKAGGVVMCDDVYLASETNSVWVGDETTQCLQTLEDAGLVKVYLVLKKLFPSKNYDRRRRKYVALVVPTSGFDYWGAPGSD